MSLLSWSRSTDHGKFLKCVKFSVTLVDNSAEGGKTQEVTFSYFMDKPVSSADSATINILQQVRGGREAVSLFALQGKKHGEGYSFETSKDFFVDKTSGERANSLALVAESLHTTPKDMRDIIAVNAERRNYEAEEGSEIFCRRRFHTMQAAPRATYRFTPYNVPSA